MTGRDEQEAGAFGINGVPFYLFNRKYAVSGAQPSELFLKALEKAWEDEPKLTFVEGESQEGAVCADGVCAPRAVPKGIAGSPDRR